MLRSNVPALYSKLKQIAPSLSGGAFVFIDLNKNNCLDLPKLKKTYWKADKQQNQHEHKQIESKPASKPIPHHHTPKETTNIKGYI